jgi:hypothetical protein
MDTNAGNSHGIVDRIRFIIGNVVAIISGLLFISTTLFIIPFIPIWPNVPDNSWKEGLPYSGIPIWYWPGYTLKSLIGDTTLFPIKYIVISIITAIILSTMGYIIVGHKSRKSVTGDPKNDK